MSRAHLLQLLQPRGQVKAREEGRHAGKLLSSTSGPSGGLQQGQTASGGGWAAGERQPPGRDQKQCIYHCGANQLLPGSQLHCSSGSAPQLTCRRRQAASTHAKEFDQRQQQVGLPGETSSSSPRAEGVEQGCPLKQPRPGDVFQQTWWRRPECTRQEVTVPRAATA